MVVIPILLFTPTPKPTEVDNTRVCHYQGALYEIHCYFHGMLNNQELAFTRKKLEQVDGAPSHIPTPSHISTHIKIPNVFLQSSSIGLSPVKFSSLQLKWSRSHGVTLRIDVRTTVRTFRHLLGIFYVKVPTSSLRNKGNSVRKYPTYAHSCARTDGRRYLRKARG